MAGELTRAGAGAGGTWGRPPMSDPMRTALGQLRECDEVGGVRIHLATARALVARGWAYETCGELHCITPVGRAALAAHKVA